MLQNIVCFTPLHYFRSVVRVWAIVWETGSLFQERDISVRVYWCISVQLWETQDKHNIVLLYLRKSRNLYSWEFQNIKTIKMDNSTTRQRKKHVYFIWGWTVQVQLLISCFITMLSTSDFTHWLSIEHINDLLTPKSSRTKTPTDSYFQYVRHVGFFTAP